MSLRGHSAVSGNSFGHHNWKGGCYWPLVGRGGGPGKDLVAQRTDMQQRITGTKISLASRLRNPSYFVRFPMTSSVLQFDILQCTLQIIHPE